MIRLVLEGAGDVGEGYVYVYIRLYTCVGNVPT